MTMILLFGFLMVVVSSQFKQFTKLLASEVFYLFTLLASGVLLPPTPTPRIHIFLWLLANNKILTRDNLAKRKRVDVMSCLFCAEPEMVHHLFFDCVVARVC